jgi:hypothetical protein
MAKSGQYKSVHLHEKLSTITGDPKAGGMKPDVAGIRKDTGGVDTVEHPSKSQTTAQMDQKGKVMQQKLESVGKGGTHQTRPISTALKGNPGMRGSGTVGAIVAVGGAAVTVAQDPTEQGVQNAIGQAVTGVICGAMGGCGDAK